jgi:tetratricopeptide (TPR) repeat protein
MLFDGTAEGVRRQHGRPRTPDGDRLLMRKTLLRNRFVLDKYALRISEPPRKQPVPPRSQRRTRRTTALGAARSDSIDAARKDLARLQELRANLIKANSEGTWQEYWVSQIQNHQQVVRAWISYTQGRRDEALQLLRTAADLEDSTETDPVMPGHLISARELLGDMLMEMNEPAQALQAFEAALKMEPSRFWTLFGAAQAADRAGDSAKAKTFFTRLVTQTADADPERPALKVARAFLAKR